VGLINGIGEKMRIYKISKLEKKATLSFYVSGYTEDMMGTLFGIGYQLNSKLYEWMDNREISYLKEFGVLVPRSETITMDGVSGMDDPTGTINFYVDGIKEETYIRILGLIKKYLRENGIEIGKVRKERSYMFDSEVLRIPIIKNQSFEADRPPEISLANNNMFFIFRDVLGIDKDLWKDNTFDAKELLDRINYFEGETRLPEGAHAGKPFIKMSPKDLTNPENLDFLSGRQGASNYDESKVREILSMIKELCQWALDHGYKTLYLS
jgi:hypothetical protein